MLVAPDSTTRVAASETAVLQLEADAAIDSATLRPRFGGEQGLPVEGNAVTLPVLKAPDTARIDWKAGGETLFTTYIEVVSRHYFRLDALKGYGDGQDDFDQLPEEQLFQARQAATEVFERNARRSFVARIGRTKDYGRERCVTLEHGDAHRGLRACERLPSGARGVLPAPVLGRVRLRLRGASGSGVPRRLGACSLHAAPVEPPHRGHGREHGRGLHPLHHRRAGRRYRHPGGQRRDRAVRAGGEPRMVTFKAARDELYRRMAKVAEGFGELYPGVQAPKVYDGFPTSEPPFYIAVDSIVDTATMGGRAVPGAGQLDFTVHVMCFARHSDQATASATLLAYVDAVFNAVMADQRLRMTVDNSFPSIEAAGVSGDSSKYHMAAASVGVQCSVFAKCPQKFREVVQ